MSVKKNTQWSLNNSVKKSKHAYETSSPQVEKSNRPLSSNIWQKSKKNFKPIEIVHNQRKSDLTKLQKMKYEMVKSKTKWEKVLEKSKSKENVNKK